MCKKSFLLILCVFLFSYSGFSQTPPPEDDVQFWNDTSVTFPLLKTTGNDGKETTRLEGFISGTLRLGQNVRHFTDERIGGGINYKINKYFSASTSYLYSADQAYKGARRGFEHRLRFDFEAGKKWKNFSVKDRNRIEYRIRNSRSDSARYRNKIQAQFPIRRDNREIVTLFVADEPYYEFSQNAWTRNEFSVGVSRSFTPNFTGELFYMLQNSTGTVLRRRDIIGINLKFKID